MPVQIGEFDARQSIIVTFNDGSQIQGKITTGGRVELRKAGAVYRSTISDLTESEIVLSDCRFICRNDDHFAERARLLSARHDVGEGLDGVTFQRADIASVDAVRLDVLKTTSRAVFWTLTSAVSAFLLSEKS